MKRMAVCLLLAALALNIGGCGKGQEKTNDPIRQIMEDLDEQGFASSEGLGNGMEEPEEETEERTEEGVEEEPEEENDIWQQCLEMDENARMGAYPDITINSIKVGMDWTVKDFLERGLFDGATSIEVRTVAEQEGEHVYNTVNPTPEELEAGMKGSDVFIITDSFTASFSMPGTSFENETTLIAQDMPLSTFTAKDNFDCQGIVPGVSKTDVAEKLGPTQWGGNGLTYICGASTQGYTEFTFDDDALKEVYVNIEN